MMQALEELAVSYDNKDREIDSLKQERNSIASELESLKVYVHVYTCILLYMDVICCSSFNLIAGKVIVNLCTPSWRRRGVGTSSLSQHCSKT